MPKTETIVIIAAGILSIPLFLFVHQFYAWVCVCHVRRYCGSHSISISGWRIAPKFDENGIKTEKSQIEVLSEAGDEKRIFRFTVWPFGIQSVAEVDPQKMKTEPNQSLVPTTTAVTSPAAQEPRQPRSRHT